MCNENSMAETPKLNIVYIDVMNSINTTFSQIHIMLWLIIGDVAAKSVTQLFLFSAFSFYIVLFGTYVYYIL